MKTLVVYYSRTGNNRFVAQRLADALTCEVEEIRPAFGGFFFLLAGSALKIGVGNRRLRNDPAAFDRVILCGPIWMGTVVQPLRAFLSKYRKTIKSLTFVTACGSDEKSKDGGFGYETVFAKIRDLVGPALDGAHALSVSLVPGSGADTTKSRLDETTFTGELAARFESLVAGLR